MHKTHQHPLISRNLTRKYSPLCLTLQASPLACLHPITQIVAPKHFLNPTRVHYTQIEHICTVKQYLKRYYHKGEFPGKRAALTEYYKFHRNWPWHADGGIGVLMMGYMEASNKEQRKFIKKLMGEPDSLSVSESCTGNTSRSIKGKPKDREGSQFSLKLKDLDFDSSSMILSELCMKINMALCDVKPLYFYQGTYRDGVKEFKNFIMQNRKNLIAGKKKAADNMHQQSSNSDPHDDKQNQNRPNKAQVQTKFDSNKQFRKTFNILPSSALRKISKTQNLSRQSRNKTVNCKPQSFSKTTANETVSRDDYAQQPCKKRNHSSIRIRKCRSANRNFSTLQKTKESSKLLMHCQDFKKKQQKQEEQKLQATAKFVRPPSGQLKRLTSESKSKRTLKKVLSKTTIERSLTRQDSRPNIARSPLVKDIAKAEPKKGDNPLQSLIKAKLKLRG